MASQRPLVVHEFGDPAAPPMVLAHGLTEAGTTWPDAVRRWSGAWHLIAPDQRGHGCSPRFTEDELRSSPDVWLADLVALVGGLRTRPVLVGHSLGGLFAVRLADQHPELVRGLVLEDPAQPSGDWRPDPDFVAEQDAFLDRFAAGTAAERERMRRESRWSEDEIDAWAECKPLVDRRMIEDGLHLGSADWTEVYERLTVPTLLVVPEEGEMSPAAIDNPLVRIARIPAVGHCVRRDDPTAFHAVVDPFLASLGGG